MTAHLELDGLTQRFGGHVALNDMTLHIERGELVSLLGPSGCGKTTALRIAAGFQRPTAGRVIVGGKDLTDVRPAGRDMGMVFQAYSLFPHLTAAENVAFGLRLRKAGPDERRRRVAELLELVGLSDAAGRRPHQLSGGMQQRVALARALATQPDVLLLDEPLSALDAQVRVQLRDEIRQLQQRLGITTVFVTHDQEEALSISDRVAVMAEGRIEQLGSPADIYHHPISTFVARFIGTMNCLPVTTGAHSGEVVIEGAPLEVARSTGSPGEAGLLLVRPEALVLEATAGRNGHHLGMLVATVGSRQFLGPIVRITATTDGGIELRADVPSTRAGQLAAGTRVRVRFAPDDARVIETHAC